MLFGIDVTMQSTDPAVLPELFDAIWTLGSRYWWAFCVLVLAWYMRWYALARFGGENNADAGWATGAALWGMLKHAFTIGRRTAVILGIIGAFVIAGLGWIFNILPTIAIGIGTGDPTTIATVVSMLVALMDPFQHPAGTPRNTLIAFIVTFASIFILKHLRDMQELTEDFGDDDSEEADDD